MARYSTRDEARQYVVDTLGEHADEFDVDAITDAAFEYEVERDETGAELLNTAGFYPTMIADEFWQLVERHAK